MKNLRAVLAATVVAGTMLGHVEAARAVDYVVGYRYSRDFILAQGPNYPSGCASCGGTTPDCLVTSNAWVYGGGIASNASTGDAFAFVGPGIVAATRIDFIFTHIGLMNGQGAVRHNTADPTTLASSISLYYGTSFWGTIASGLALLAGGGYGMLHADPWASYNMVPGLMSSKADGGESFGFWRDYAPEHGNQVTYQLTSTAPAQPWRSQTFLAPPTSAALRSDATAAFNWMQSNSRYYRLFGFENVTTADAGNGNVCSGTVATATKKVTLTASSSVGPFALSSVDTGNAVLNLEAFLYNTIRWDFVSPNSPSIIGSGDRDGMSWGVTDQIMSCFVTYQPTSGCTLMNHDYHRRAQKSAGLITDSTVSALPAASAVAPDHIMLGGSPATVGKTTGGVVRKNRYGGFNAGPWNAAPIVTPTWSTSYWTHMYWGQCVATQSNAG